MPRSVYWPFMHISQSPAAQAPHGTGSRRRTMPTTRSPAPNPVPGAASATRPSDSCPMMRRSWPGGADPYSPLIISRSVPQMPIACVWTRIGPSSCGGSGMSVSATEPCCPGMTVTARISLTITAKLISPRYRPDALASAASGYVCPFDDPA